MELKPGFEYCKLSDLYNFNRTSWNWNLFQYLTSFLAKTILIEPVGIETTRWQLNRQYIRNILIEPVGIETSTTLISPILCVDFNRTSWNWNFCSSIWRPKRAYFNRTSWNWNGYHLENYVKLVYFNRTSWNWNKFDKIDFDYTFEILIEPVGIET